MSALTILRLGWAGYVTVPRSTPGVPAGRWAGMAPGVTFSHGDATLKAIDAGRHTSNMIWKGQPPAAGGNGA